MSQIALRPVNGPPGLGNGRRTMRRRVLRLRSQVKHFKILTRKIDELAGAIPNIEPTVNDVLVSYTDNETNIFFEDAPIVCTDLSVHTEELNDGSVKDEVVHQPISKMPDSDIVPSVMDFDLHKFAHDMFFIWHSNVFKEADSTICDDQNDAVVNVPDLLDKPDGGNMSCMAGFLNLGTLMTETKDYSEQDRQYWFWYDAPPVAKSISRMDVVNSSPLDMFQQWLNAPPIERSISSTDIEASATGYFTPRENWTDGADANAPTMPDKPHGKGNMSCSVGLDLCNNNDVDVAATLPKVPAFPFTVQNNVTTSRADITFNEEECAREQESTVRVFSHTQMDTIVGIAETRANNALEAMMDGADNLVSDMIHRFAKNELKDIIVEEITDCESHFMDEVESQINRMIDAFEKKIISKVKHLENVVKKCINDKSKEQ